MTTFRALQAATPVEPRIRTRETAPLLGVSLRKVQAMCATGQLRASRVGGIWTIAPSEIERFLRATQRLPQGPRPPKDPPPKPVARREVNEAYELLLKRRS